jgi:hypothetical protein
MGKLIVTIWTQVTLIAITTPDISLAFYLTHLWGRVQWTFLIRGVEAPAALKVRLKLPLRLSKTSSKHVGGVEAKLCTVLTSVSLLDSKQSHSLSGRFTTRKELAVPTGQESGWAPQPWLPNIKLVACLYPESLPSRFIGILYHCGLNIYYMSLIIN